MKNKFAKVIISVILVGIVAIPVVSKVGNIGNGGTITINNIDLPETTF